MMNIRLNFSFLFVLFLFSGSAFGQEVLTIDEAIDLAIQYNFDISLAQKSSQQAELLTDIKNTGLLPTVQANASGNYNLNTAWIKPRNQDFSKNPNVATQNYGLSVGASYLIYDGSFRKYNWEKFKALHQLTEIEARSIYEQVATDIINQYYQIARIAIQTDNQRQSLTISKERVTRAEYGVEFGQSSGLEVLRAQVDVNNDSITLQNTLLLLDNAKRSLNQFIGRDVDTEFDVDKQIAFQTELTKEQLTADALENNIQLRAAERNISLNDLDLKMAKAGLLPTVSLSASYGGSLADYGVTGFFEKQNALGLSAGIQVAWPIFDGGRNKISQQTAIINKETNIVRRDKLAYEIESNINNTWASYQYALSILPIQSNNILTAEETFELTKERYAIGQVSSIDFRQAQLNLLQSQIAYEQAKFDAKLLEVVLIRLSGGLGR